MGKEHDRVPITGTPWVIKIIILLQRILKMKFKYTLVYTHTHTLKIE